MLILPMALALDGFVISSIVLMSDFAAWQKIILVCATIAAYIAFFAVQTVGDTRWKRVVGRTFFYALGIGVIAMAISGSAWFVVVSVVISLAFKTFFTIFSAPKS